METSDKKRAVEDANHVVPLKKQRKNHGDDNDNDNDNDKGKDKIDNKKQIRHVKDKSTRYYDHYEFKLESLDDFFIIDDFYMSGKVNKSKTSNIQFSTIHRLIPSIQKFSNLIGLHPIKKQILEMIVYFLQRFDKDQQDYLHTVVYGSPGVGKTALIQVLAEIYAKLGVLKSNKVTSVKRADLIGQYLGHTAMKTKKVIEDAMGGVLLIDEAYSLGDTEQRDSFSRECIDTLNQYLSEHRGEFICIIAGYKEDLDQRFFKSNPGLERRFPFRLSISDYSAADLRQIFFSIVRNQGWQMVESDIPLTLFEKHMDYFKFNGGDMETLFTRIKFIHSMRVFGDDLGKKKKLIVQDVEQGMKTFVGNDHVQQRKKEMDFISHLYM